MNVKLYGLILAPALVLTLLATLGGAAGAWADEPDWSQQVVALSEPQESQAGQAIIIDHTCTDISQIPDYWLGKAKEHLLHYAHTSHGGQIFDGMSWLYQQNSKYNFYQLLAPPDHPPTELATQCQPGQLCIYDGQPGYDGNPYEDYITPELYWSTSDGVSRTQVVANTGLYRYSMWSWCGQQSDNDEGTVQQYLNTLNGLETQYPNMRFIYMTGHTDGTGTGGTLYRNNNLVRQYVRDHGKVLFDFADIESYDPDGTYYPDTDDHCPWCEAWCAAHSQECASLPDSCTHSQEGEGTTWSRFNCKLKSQAFWWMMARLAGWPGPGGQPAPDLSSSTKQASQLIASPGDRLTYTIRLINTGGPLTTTVYVTDVVPSDLAYVPGSLSASTGITNAAGSTLRWSGILSSTPVVTITYAVTVTYGIGSGTDIIPKVITNLATIAAPGYPTLTRPATVIAGGHAVYLPVVLR